MVHVHGLVVKQPWASLIASGQKTIEVRPRRTHYRGPLLLSVSGRPEGEHFAGHALAVIELYACRRLTPTREDGLRSCVEYRSGAYAWEIRRLYALDEPFRVRGSLGIYRLPVDDMPDELRISRLVHDLAMLCSCEPGEV